MVPLFRVSPTRLVLVAALALALLGCSSKKKDDYVEKPVDELYDNAMNLIAKEEYSDAAKAFDEVDRQHPNSVWATKAQLMGAYALYQANKDDEAVIALDRFIQLHPAYKDVAYAYYLKGLCYYEQIEDVQRDQKITEQALTALQEVVTRFPDSRYAIDARFKLDLVRDQLAGKELAIGRFYERQHQYLAAINRYRNVVDTYQTTSQVPEALERLVECYQALGLTDEAKKVAAVLGYNYPGSTWYADSYDLAKGDAGATPPSAPAASAEDKKAEATPAASRSTSGSGWFSWLPWPF